MTPDIANLSALSGGMEITSLEKLHGDGSARGYWRLRADGRALILQVGPELAENAAWLRVNRHLAAHGVRVPAIIGTDEQRGWTLMEDLGEVSLFTLRKRGGDWISAYRKAIDLLLRMQIEGAEGFSLATGFAASPYDRATMIEMEALYFIREFAEGVMGAEPDEASLTKEFDEMAETASGAPSAYFLHRDFQSRNIHLVGGECAVIDFQGARPGPLAYDLAALLFDPYAKLDDAAISDLFGYYRARAVGAYGVDWGSFSGSWPIIASFRMMQALGAFGKLGHRLGKPNFLEHSGTALKYLVTLLDAPECARFAALRALVSSLAGSWEARA